jgi:hypothetical protein
VPPAPMTISVHRISAKTEPASRRCLPAPRVRITCNVQPSFVRTACVRIHFLPASSLSSMSPVLAICSV